MPLQRQDLELPLSGGLLQQVDERVLPSGRWARVDNLLPQRQGALTKRQGYGRIPTATYPPGDTVARVVDAIDSRLDEVLVYGEHDNATRVWSWSDTLNRWIDKDDVSPCATLVQTVASGYSGIVSPRVSVTSGGAIAWQWRNAYQVGFGANDEIIQRVEEANGAVRQDETRMAFAGLFLSAEQVAVGDDVVTLWIDTAVLAPIQFRTTDTLTGVITATSTIGVINVSVFAACQYDATRFLIAYVDAANPADVGLSLVLADGTPVSGVIINNLDAIRLTVDAVPGVGGILQVYSIQGGGSVLTVGLNDLFFTASWGPLIDVPGPVIVQAMGCCIGDDGTETACASWSPSPFLNGVLTTTSQTRDNAGVATGNNNAINTIIAHQPFRRDGVSYVSMTAYDSVHSEYGETCLVRCDGFQRPVIKASLVRNAGGITSILFFAVGQALARIAKTGDNTYLAPFPIRVVDNDDASASIAALLNTYAVGCALDFSRRQSALRWPAEQRDCLAHSGGYCGWYDGTCDVETGFTSAPQVFATTISTVGGNMPSNSDFLYSFVWEWYDERGNLHQSEPTLPLRVHTTALPAANTYSVQLDVNTLALTRKGDSTDGVSKEATLSVYRTTNDGTLFYRLTPQRGPAASAILNDKALSQLVYIDTHADADLDNASSIGFLGLGFLYTTGDILGNQLPPAPRAIVSTKNRLWIASAENPRELWFSKVIVSGEGPCFSRSLVLSLDDANDEITALAAMDDKVIVFTRDRVYYVSGDGPNDTGGGGSFLGPFRLPVDIGCADQRSVVTYPEGVLYWDGTQIVRLTRGLGLEGFGDAVLDITDDAVSVIAKLDAFNSRVYFLVERDTTLPRHLFAVLDYKFGQWVTHTQWGETDSGRTPVKTVAQHWHNGYHWISTDDVNPTIGRTQFGPGALAGFDVGTWFPSTIETPWIHLAGVNGYQRAWDVTFTGRRLSEHKLTFEVLTDYDNATIRQSMVVDVDVGSPMLGLDVERISLRLRSQTCSAVKFRIYDFEGATTFANPAGWDVAGLTIGIGIKPGNARLPARNRG
jgi:hypothetical protein